MKLKNLLVGAATAGALAINCGGVTHATELSFSFSGSGFSGSGDFYTAGTPGNYVVTGVKGVAADPNYNLSKPSPITGLNGFFGFADNFLYFPFRAYVDGGGIGLTTADNNQYNITSDDVPGYGLAMASYYVFDASSPYSSVAQISFTVSPVPEPWTWALILAGFGGVGAALRLARGKQASITT